MREGNLKFYAQTLEEFAAREPSSSYGAIIVNMTLHSVSDIQGFMFAVAKLLHPDGVMIATIPNPGVYLQSRPDLDVSGLICEYSKRLISTFESATGTRTPRRSSIFTDQFDSIAYVQTMRAFH